jgi:nucleoside-diphosphate-sugar epimerase
MIYTPIPLERLRLADIADFEAVRQAVAGIHSVVHLAADPSGQGGWESVLHNNIIGSHNLFEACRLEGVRRVIFASTNQVVFGYRDTEFYKRLFSGKEDMRELSSLIPAPVDHTRPTRPLNDYACSKVYGEALAHQYAYSHNLSCIILRIGWVLPNNQLPTPSGQILWCSQRDCVQMVERCLRAPAELRFDIFFAQSDNCYNLVDIQHARDVLGYAPQDGIK